MSRPKNNNPDCWMLLGATGVYDGDPAEQVLVPYTIPNDGNWYVCRVDDEHGALPIAGNNSDSFVYGQNYYALTIATSDRWIDIDEAFLSNKTKREDDNEWPGQDMYLTNGCQRVGIGS